MVFLQSFGSNGSGQLGIGHQDDVSTPQPVLLPSSLVNNSSADSRLRHIAAGGNHTLLLFSTGTILWSGDHTTGACGRVEPTSPAPTPTTRFQPLDLSGLPQGEGCKIEHVAATWEASVIASSSGDSGARRVYSFGSGAKGELGLGPGTLRATEPTEIPNFPPPGTEIVHLAACMGHVVAVLDNGEAWGWGNGRKGQLGEPAMGAVYSPRRIEGAEFKVVKAVCGREFTCLFGPPETGELLVLGSDKWGVKSQAPKAVARWAEVGAGWGSVFVLKDDGTLLSWGRNDHGQLAPEDLGNAKAIAVGSEHAMALTETGDLLAWGWGEHGNCGPIRDDSGQKGQRNKIASTEPGTKIAMIAAGCATSWIAFDRRP